MSGRCVLQFGMGNVKPLVPQPTAADVALPLSCEYWIPRLKMYCSSEILTLEKVENISFILYVWIELYL